MDLIDLPGVGEKTAKILLSHGISTIRDLQTYFPRAYRTYYPADCAHLPVGEWVSLLGTVTRPTSHHTGRVNTQLATFHDKSGSLSLRWFNSPFITRSVHPETPYAVRGKVEVFNARPQIVNPTLRDPGTHQNQIQSAYIEPIYTSIGTIKSGNLRKIIAAALEIPVTDPLPPELRTRFELVDRQTALHHIHFPATRTDLEGAIHRLGFDELYALQLESLKSREHNQVKTDPLHWNTAILQNWITALPFSPTSAQIRVISEILADLQRNVAMHRLLQGEVGSGKTLVAAWAALAVSLAGKQTLVLAPTQILAEQLHRSLAGFLPGLSVSLVTHEEKGDTGAQVVVGTQALLQDKHSFSRVGLVIVDEQHRFGVEQRLLLTHFVPAPHFLMMTATPIPRTAAMATLSGLDLSRLDELPKDRLPVKTYYVSSEKRADAYSWIQREVKAGNQAFVVVPLIDAAEDEEGNAKKSIVQMETDLRHLLPEAKIDVMHGRMKEAEKNAHLHAFRDGATEILVATSMIEVGIDIPAANIIVIEDAERFGLSQLHQLRGRVGRGGGQGYCLLFSKLKSPKSRDRITYFVKETDGARLAQYDLKARGPGELYGLAQHGFYSLRFASLFDGKLVDDARTAALSVAKRSISP